MSFSVVIPARYQSKRLPGKPLLDIAGKPMIQHVYERALESGAEEVLIATDDDRIKKAAENFGATVCMTNIDHKSGTERLAEVVTALEFDDDDIVVNVQGDEPLISPKAIYQVAMDLKEHELVKVSTICKPIVDINVLTDPSKVKVVLNKRGFALYFSRAPIPWERETFPPSDDMKVGDHHFRHIGLYAYRARFLREYAEMDPCYLERMEDLEQLRVLWHGCRIHAVVSNETIPHGVDTEEDLERVRAAFDKKVKI